MAVEAKSARTLPGDALDGLRRWRALAGKDAPTAALVHGGDAAYLRDGASILPWFAV